MILERKVSRQVDVVVFNQALFVVGLYSERDDPGRIEQKVSAKTLREVVMWTAKTFRLPVWLDHEGAEGSEALDIPFGF